MRNWIAVLFFGSAFAGVVQATQDQGTRRDKPADAAELAQIAARGRAIAAYDQVAWHATDAVIALHPPDSEVGMYLARLTSDGWVGGFGHLNESKTRFLLAYEVTGADMNRSQVKHNVPAIEDDGSWLEEARAFETVHALVGGWKPTYNLAIVPADGGRWFVYAYPAQTVNGVFPAGGDYRYTLSPEGTRIEATRKLHSSILEFQVSEVPKDATEPQTFRTEFLDDAPEDTDVAMVLMMGHVPMIVATTNYTYQIAGDGMPSYLMPTEKFMKKLKAKP